MLNANNEIDQLELLENVRTLLGVMALAHANFGEFMDWLSEYLTCALLDPVETIETMSADIASAQQEIHDKSASILAQMPTAGGVH